MRRIDRAIFAIFLLALVADVARSYASTPVSSEVSGSLILSAASQFPNSSSTGAVPTHRHGNSCAASFAKRAYRAPVFAAWSKVLFIPSAQWNRVALLQPVAILAPQSAYRADTQQHFPSSSLAQFEHAANPAP